MKTIDTTIHVDPPTTARPQPPPPPPHMHTWQFGTATLARGIWHTLLWCKCGELKATGTGA